MMNKSFSKLSMNICEQSFSQQPCKSVWGDCLCARRLPSDPFPLASPTSGCQNDANPHPVASLIEGEINRLLLAASASNTHKTYQTGWRVFCTFMGHQLDGGHTASPEDVRKFITWLSLQRFAPSMIATYVPGVGYHHKICS